MPTRLKRHLLFATIATLALPSALVPQERRATGASSALETATFPQLAGMQSQQSGQSPAVGTPEKAPLTDPAEQDQSASEQGDPLLGNRIFQAVASGGRLWLLGSQGLISLGIGDESRQVHFESGVLDMSKAGHDLWVLWQPSPKEHKVVVSVWTGGSFEDLAQFEFSDQDHPFALLSCAEGPCVLSTNAVRVLSADHKHWRRIALHGKLRGGTVTLPTNRDAVYVGSNMGEWGGGLQRVNIRTGEVINVERRDSRKLCAGPLNRDCDPVTGLIPDPEHYACVLASVGLVHMMSHGRILRVCGRSVTSIWERSVPWDESMAGALSKLELPATNNVKREDPGETEAVYGLELAADGGFWAVTPRALYLFAGDGTQLKEYTLPALKSVSGIHLTRELPGVIVVATDANWAVSLSGYTPLVVPIESPRP